MLINELEQQGNFLFKKRGTLPLLIVAAGIPVAYFTERNYSSVKWYEIICLLIAMGGFFIRVLTVGFTPRGTSGRNIDKQIADELNTTGAYSMVRHPLYVGNFFMWLGICMMTYNAWFVLAVCLLYWIYYERIMFAEEQFLSRQFGEKYIEWASRVPAFIPSFRLWQRPREKFNFRKVMRQEKNGLLAVFLVFFIVCAAGQGFDMNAFLSGQLFITIGLAVSLLAYLVLKFLKYNTAVLNDR